MSCVRDVLSSLYLNNINCKFPLIIFFARVGPACATSRPSGPSSISTLAIPSSDRPPQTPSLAFSSWTRSVVKVLNLISPLIWVWSHLLSEFKVNLISPLTWVWPHLATISLAAWMISLPIWSDPIWQQLLTAFGEIVTCNNKCENIWDQRY